MKWIKFEDLSPYIGQKIMATNGRGEIALFTWTKEYEKNECLFLQEDRDNVWFEDGYREVYDYICWIPIQFLNDLLPEIDIEDRIKNEDDLIFSRKDNLLIDQIKSKSKELMDNSDFELDQKEERKENSYTRSFGTLRSFLKSDLNEMYEELNHPGRKEEQEKINKEVLEESSKLFGEALKIAFERSPSLNLFKSIKMKPKTGKPIRFKKYKDKNEVE